MRLFARRLALFAVVTAAAGWLASHVAAGWHPSERTYPRQGIDVSHHQGAIDWPHLPAQGVRFAYIKASEGGDWRDPAFERNWTGARAAGVDRGAYHFFTLCRPGAEQAANFLAAAPPTPDSLPPAVDLEHLGNCAAKLSPAAFHAELAAFVHAVEGRHHKQVVLYLTQEFDDAYHVTAAVRRPFWLRSLVREPRFGAAPWTMWQASNFRRLDGVQGRVDWNVARP